MMCICSSNVLDPPTTDPVITITSTPSSSNDHLYQGDLDLHCHWGQTVVGHHSDLHLFRQTRRSGHGGVNRGQQQRGY